MDITIWLNASVHGECNDFGYGADVFESTSIMPNLK